MTWLYGPLHTVSKSEQNDRYAPQKSSTHDKLCLTNAPDPPLNDKCVMGTPSIPSAVTRIIAPEASVSLSNKAPSMPTQRQPLKSAMKKITMSDILRRSLSQVDICGHYNEQGTCSYGDFDNHRQPKLRFNGRVEQYRAVSDDEDDDEVYSSDHSWSNRSDGSLVTTVDHRPKYHQHSHTKGDDSSEQLSTSDTADGYYSYHSDDSDYEYDGDESAIPHHHHPYNSNLTIPAHLTARSIKRLEPAILKNSNSHFDTSRDEYDGDEKHALDSPIKHWAKHSCDAPVQDHWQHSSGKSGPTVESPAIFLRPGKTPPISQSCPIDAIPYHPIDTRPCHSRIVDQQQQQQQQQKHHSPPSLLESLVKGHFMFGIHR